MKDRRTPKAGETWWSFGHKIQVTRVSVKHGWADIYVTAPNGLMWSKRQPLPFPNDFAATEKHGEVSE